MSEHEQHHHSDATRREGEEAAHSHGEDSAPAHIHSHRALIGFDENGIPVVTREADHNDPNDPESFIRDYNAAVAAYRKTFPTKSDVAAQTPDPAVREMLAVADQLGIETPFDRFDQQKPHCSFGLAGVCCKVCNMGPCRVTAMSPRGVCGADADLIVARNLLRAAAAGVAQHGMHAREVMPALKWAADGRLNLPILGEQKVLATAKAFGIETEGRDLKAVASELADRLLDDLSRTVPADHETLKACAPAERREVWRELDILPISAYHEVFEAYHKSGCGVDGDWKSVMQQFLRCGLANALGCKIFEAPFAFTSPEWGNEKGIDAALGFRLMGVSSYHCVEAQIHGSKNVVEFLKEGTRELLGSTMNVDVNPTRLGEKIVEDLKRKRAQLGWDA